MILECKDLRKTYLSGDNKVNAIDGVTVSFEEGEFCAITGPSGSGKSTLLHVLSSLEKLSEGDIIYDGNSLKKYNDNQLSILRRRRFGFVFQAYNLVAELTGLENILLPVMLDKKKPDEEYINHLIDVLGIKERIEHLPSAMSGGQQQRVAIARALANKPRILFADEPTGNLDAQSGKEVMALLKQVSKEFGITLILVTHDAGIAAQADRILTIVDGKITGDKSNADIDTNVTECNDKDDTAASDANASEGEVQ